MGFDAGGCLEDGQDGVDEVEGEVVHGEESPGRCAGVHEAGLVGAGPDDEASDLAAALGGDRRGEVRDGRQEVAGAAGDAGVDGDGVADVGREPRVAWVFGGSCVHRSGRARQTMWA